MSKKSYQSEVGSNDKKGYSAFPKGPGLERHHWTQFNALPRTLIGGGEEVYLSPETLLVYSIDLADRVS